MLLPPPPPGELFPCKAQAERKQPFCRAEREASREHPMLLNVADATRQLAAEAGLPAISQLSRHQTRVNIMDQLIQEVASPRTHTILKEYYEQSKVRPPRP